jgi:hypothetical protein
MLAILAKPLSRVKSVVPWSKAIAAIKTSVVVVTPETLQNLRDDHSSERNGFCVGDHGATWDLTSARDASQSRKRSAAIRDSRVYGLPSALTHLAG